MALSLTFNEDDGADAERAVRSLDGGKTFSVMTPPFRFHDTAFIVPGLAVIGGQQEPLPATAAELTSIATSSDEGATWTKRSCPVMRVRALAYGGGVYVAGGEPLSSSDPAAATSTDGITWTGRSSPFQSGVDIWDIVWTGSVFLAMAPYDSHQYATSGDGVTWSALASLPAPAAVRRSAEHGTVVRNGEVFVYMAEGADTSSEVPVVYRSTDLVSWTREALTLDGGSWPLDETVYNAHYASYQSLFMLAAGGFSTFAVKTSTDGVAFTSRASGVTRVEAVGSGPDGLYAGGYVSPTYWGRSDDGVTWTNPAHPNTSTIDRVFGQSKVVVPATIGVKTGRAFFDRV